MASTTIFLIMFVVFSAVLVSAGLFSKRWVSESSDFILAGREVSTLINMMGVSAIGFAGTTIALAPGFTVLMGFQASLAWGSIYSILGLLLFGLLFSGFIRRNGAQTLPEYLEMRYNGTVRSVVAITSVIGMSGILANNIVSCANTITGYTGWDQSLIVAVIFAIIIGFTFISGLWAATITDFFQVMIGVVAIPLLLMMLIKRYGGFDAVNAAWPGGNFVTSGIGGASIAATKLTYPSLLNFVILFAAALVWGNNYYWMKVASCRSEKVAKRSFILAAIFLVVVFMIPLGLVGAYAGAFFGKNFIPGGGKMLQTAAYGVVVKSFVPLLGSFFIIGAVAASISTASTAALGASAVATRDIYQRMFKPSSDPKKSLKVSKYIMVGIGLLTWILCQFPGGPTYLFAFSNAWLVPPAILLGLGAFWPRFNARGALWGAIAGMLSMFALTLLGDVLKVFIINKYIYMATLGFAITLVVAVIAALTDKPKYYGAADWERIPTAKNRKDVNLSETEMTVLRMIHLGHLYMSDITDALGVDSKASSVIIENLDQGGYIVRAGLSGSNFYSFGVTEKGLAALPELPSNEASMAAEGLTPMYLELLEMVKNNPEKQAEFVKHHEIRSMRMASISAHLTRQGYIIEGGLFKRKLRVTEKGTAAVQKFAVKA
jgi:solute:Na+ symporter, SSS family